jgi:hypothetical protein
VTLHFFCKCVKVILLTEGGGEQTVRVLTRDGPLRKLAGVWRLFDALTLYSVNGRAIVYLFCSYPQVEPTEKMMNDSQ